jgi:hypothetical protein
MPNDTWYGADCELRIGVMANAETDPTAWAVLEFMSITKTPTRERRARPKLGSARHNALDPIKPRAGFKRLAADLVLDADTRSFPLLLRSALGPAVTSGPTNGVYTHTWSSGNKTTRLFALVIKVGDNDYRISRGLTFGSLSAQVGGEQTQDFDIGVGLRGLSWDKLSAWPTGAVTAAPVEAPLMRAVLQLDQVDVSNTLSASWSWDRQLQEDVFLSRKPEISGLRPGESALSGTATFRAVGEVFDAIADEDDVFNARLLMVGVVADHAITFEHPQVMIPDPALSVGSPAQIERTIGWTGHQSANNPGAKITVANNVAAYL